MVQAVHEGPLLVTRNDRSLYRLRKGKKEVKDKEHAEAFSLASPAPQDDT